eukprot:scaffold83310_cov25-Tisochrysis_lutea.AAC.1
MLYTPDYQATFVAEHLGPTLEKDHPEVKIIGCACALPAPDFGSARAPTRLACASGSTTTRITCSNGPKRYTQTPRPRRTSLELASTGTAVSTHRTFMCARIASGYTHLAACQHPSTRHRRAGHARTRAREIHPRDGGLQLRRQRRFQVAQRRGLVAARRTVGH